MTTARYIVVKTLGAGLGNELKQWLEIFPDLDQKAPPVL